MKLNFKKNWRWIGLGALFILLQVFRNLVFPFISFCLLAFASLAYLFTYANKTKVLESLSKHKKYLYFLGAVNILLFVLPWVTCLLLKISLKFYNNFFLILLIPYILAVGFFKKKITAKQ